MGISSSRLVYTKFTAELYNDYHTWYTDKEVMRYIGGRPLTSDEVQARFKKTMEMNALENIGLYAINDKSSNVFVGIAKFAPLGGDENMVEVGYGFLEQYWGNGYATEVLKALINHALKVGGIQKLIGITDAKNEKSKKVLVKCGFELLQQKEESGILNDHFQLVL